MKRLLPGAKAARFVSVSAQALSSRSVALRGLLLIAGLSAVSACSPGPIVTRSGQEYGGAAGLEHRLGTDGALAPAAPAPTPGVNPAPFDGGAGGGLSPDVPEIGGGSGEAGTGPEDAQDDDRDHDGHDDHDDDDHDDRDDRDDHDDRDHGRGHGSGDGPCGGNCGVGRGHGGGNGTDDEGQHRGHD